MVKVLPSFLTMLPVTRSPFFNVSWSAQMEFEDRQTAMNTHLKLRFLRAFVNVLIWFSPSGDVDEMLGLNTRGVERSAESNERCLNSLRRPSSLIPVVARRPGKQHLRSRPRQLAPARTTRAAVLPSRRRTRPVPCCAPDCRTDLLREFRSGELK